MNADDFARLDGFLGQIEQDRRQSQQIMVRSAGIALLPLLIMFLVSMFRGAQQAQVQQPGGGTVWYPPIHDDDPWPNGPGRLS